MNVCLNYKISIQKIQLRSHIVILNEVIVPSKVDKLSGWETGAVAIELLDFLAKDIPVDLAMYAKKHDLLEKEGWKCFRRIAN
jgi:hypothetical protein